MSKIDPLNETELAWIADNVRIAQSMAAAYEISSATMPPEVLDQIYAAYRADPLDNIDRDGVVNAIGLAFGQYLVDQLGLAWCTYAEDDRAEIAVQGHGGDLVVLPTSLVAERYASRETGFLETLFRETAVTYAQLRRTPEKRPWWKFWPQ
jgi:hypothetical protein